MLTHLTEDQVAQMRQASAVRLDAIAQTIIDNGRAGGMRLDAQDTRYLQQTLEALLDEIVKSPPLPLNGASIFRVSTNVPEWAEVYSWMESTGSGRMSLIADSGADDLPALVSGKTKIPRNVRTFGTSMRWTFMDLLRAAVMGESVQMEQAELARQVHDETINDLIFNGNTAAGLYGLLNNSDIPQKESANGAFSGMTASQMASAILDEISAMAEATSGIEVPNLCLLPIGPYNTLVKTSQGSADNKAPVLEEVLLKARLMTNNPSFEIRQVRELANVGAQVDSDTLSDVMVILNNSPLVVEYHAAMLFRQFPPQVHGLNFMVPILARVGSLDVKRPKGIRIVRGI